MNSDELFCIGHIDTNQLIQLESCKPTPKHLVSIHSTASHIVTPLLPHRWEGLLHQHPNQALASYVISGLSNSFHIGYQYSSSRRSSLSANMLSAVRNPIPVEQYLATELAAGRITSPFLRSLLPLSLVQRKIRQTGSKSTLGRAPPSGKDPEWGCLFTPQVLCPAAVAQQ